jgi:DNA-binding MarR family transcriptional regulator
MKVTTPLWIKYLMYIEDTNMCQLAHRLNITYSYLNKISKELHDKKYIEKNKIGRTNIVKLTSKGILLRDAGMIIANDIGDSKLIDMHNINYTKQEC